MTLKFSANLGFLWAELALPDAIRAAKAARFDAVELHWPYDVSAAEVAEALEETGLPCLGLNTRRGDVAAGENGLCALPGREEEALAAIDQALSYARQIGARNVHAMAGNAEGPDARQTFVGNLTYACEAAKQRGINILIEPLNRHDAPCYFLETTDQAASIINDVGQDNLRLMFDCYHVQRTEGDLVKRLNDHIGIIGHIQFASVPGRGAPDQGEINYVFVFSAIKDLGFHQPLGAEYKPGGDTAATLSWLARYK